MAARHRDIYYVIVRERRRPNACAGSCMIASTSCVRSSHEHVRSDAQWPRLSPQCVVAIMTPPRGHVTGELYRAFMHYRGPVNARAPATDDIATGDTHVK